MYGQLIYGKAVKNIQDGNDSLFNKQYLENWTATWKRIKLETYFTLSWKSTQNKDLSLRPETVKHLKENIGGKLFNISLSNDFLDLTLKLKATKAEINKSDYIK